MYCSDLTECRLDSTKSNPAYNWFVGILLVLMVATNMLTAISCPSENKFMNIIYATFSTIACWAIFVFVVYTREYMRMSFANVFGYLWVSKKANDIITHIIPKNYVDLTELLTKLSSNDDSATKYPKDKQTITELIESVPKIRIDDNFELLTYLRSGSNYIPSLRYIKNYTNKIFKSDIAAAIDSEPSTVKENADLLDLLNTLYTRDVIGEFILFILAGVMCSYLSEYLIKKISCSYKTTEEIDRDLAEYNSIYHQQEELKKKQMVVTM
jgi:hypothetical protein